MVNASLVFSKFRIEAELSTTWDWKKEQELSWPTTFILRALKLSKVGTDVPGICKIKFLKSSFKSLPRSLGAIAIILDIKFSGVKSAIINEQLWSNIAVREFKLVKHFLNTTAPIKYISSYCIEEPLISSIFEWMIYFSYINTFYSIIRHLECHASITHCQASLPLQERMSIHFKGYHTMMKRRNEC